ncbi:hypothetical protein OSB04_002774 [Centaurea solstitialis]|uniref:Uncharacterized protein n=1 Tax=Centaurea solstitialis TaxID=347529 RepID=A0AA38U145_9ASTR|nr:hypothetical protein OSB04_002774 [Centaurea solstitialis]
MLLCYVIRTALKSWSRKMHVIIELVVEKDHRLVKCASTKLIYLLHLVSNLHHYQVNVFYVVIDMQLQEPNHRFNEVNTTLLVCIACLCMRESSTTLGSDTLRAIYTLLALTLSTLWDNTCPSSLRWRGHGLFVKCLFDNLEKILKPLSVL